MKKNYRIVNFCICILLFMAMDSLAQNNLSAGDIAFVSYQSDKDLSNTENGGTTSYTDRFAIIVLKRDGLAAGTVLYFTDNGWNAGTGSFISGLSEGFIKWVVPAGGIAFNNTIYFISRYVDPVMSWGVYNNAMGTITAGTVTTESGSNYLALSTAGDQVLVYQTGAPAGAAGAYNDANRRFITAIHANMETNVTSATLWDGNNATGGHQSCIPPGLTSGMNAMLITESDNGIYVPPYYNIGCQAAISTFINSIGNWALQNTAFSDYSPVGSFNEITLQGAPVSSHSGIICNGLTTTLLVSATGGTTYQWQQSADAAFTSPVILSNTGVYSGTNTAALRIGDFSVLSGRYYRAVISNTCGSITSNATFLSVNSAMLPSSTATLTQPVNTNNNLYYSSFCALISKVVPSGASPLTGNVTGKVWVENAVPTFNNQAFVARHYQITPATGATTATGTVTLYFTQAEFNAFNAAPGSALDLPTGPTDNMGKTNLRVGKYAGSSNDGSGLPGSYSSSGVVVIDPADANIVWNAFDNRWEITFDVTGFSGFIIQTTASALPVNLTAFTGQLNNNDTYLQWKTASEIHHDYFEIERSTDGQTFTAAGRVAGTNESTVQNYTWIDAGAALLTSSKLYYRLKMVSTTADVEYSNIVIIPVNRLASPVVSVTPNPFTSHVQIGLQMPETAQLVIRLSDITGKLLKSESVHVAKGYTVLPVTGIGNLAQGIYMLSVSFNGQAYTFKIVK